MSAAVLVTLLLRVMLVLLFLPFSALDKILNFGGAVTQAREIAPSDGLAKLLILAGLGVEIFMSLAIVSGVADRAGGFVMGVYCIITALLFKRWWQPGDFWSKGDSKARTLFWDFWKNVALAGGFLLITFGTVARDQPGFLQDPFASSHPYAEITHG